MKSTRERGDKGTFVRSLSNSRFGLAIQAVLVFVLLDIGLGLLGFPGVYRLVRRWGGAASVAPPPRHVVERTLEAVRTATRYYWRRRLDCLPRAMATYLLLRSQGVSAVLHIGVKRYPFAAHAWVECLGEVLDESGSSWRHEAYVPIISS